MSTPGRIASDAPAAPGPDAVATESVPVAAANASPRELAEELGQRLRAHPELAPLLEQLKSSLVGLERSEKLQRALFAIADLAASDASMPELLRGVHAIVDSLMYAKNCFIVRLDAERDAIVFLYFVDTVDPPHLGDVSLSKRKGTLTWYVLNDGKAIRGDNEQLQSQVSGPLSYVGSDSYVWMGVPMLRDGLVQGAIVVQCYEPGIVYTEEDQAVLEFVASHVLTAMERKQGRELLEANVRQRTTELAQANKELQQEIGERQRAERLQAALFHIAELATADISQEELYQRVHTAVGELINARNFFIALLSDDRQSLEFPYSVDASGEVFSARPVGRGLSEYVLRHGRRIFRFEEMLALAHGGELDLRTVGTLAVWWLGVPLVVGDQTIGLVAVQSYDAAVAYTHADQELLGFAASQIATTLSRRRAAAQTQRANEQLELRVTERTRELRAEIAERQRIQEQLRHQVMHDALTGLPNRGYLIDRLGRVLAHLRRTPERRCALLYLDVDRFKQVNDSLGHAAGDEVLREVARRLQGCVREPDVVARLSGDEFAVLLEDVEVPGTAVKVAQRIHAALEVPLRVHHREVATTASIGIAVGDARYATADEILRDADVALYRAKAAGRSRFELFDEAMQKATSEALALQDQLRVALAEDQFEPWFQPIVRLATGEVVGYEALLRWNHPERGVIGPGDFLRIAEDGGSLEAIDWRMFEMSCALVPRLGHGRGFLTINVAARHLRRADFDARLVDLLQRTGLANARLLAEFTEAALADQPERVRATLDRLSSAGIGTALDDFGRGPSSLDSLHRFPLRMLKLDRAFVAELGRGQASAHARTVVAAILALAKALELQVVAEGIELPEELQVLRELGCEYGQGFMLGRPAPAAFWNGDTPATA